MKSHILIVMIAMLFFVSSTDVCFAKAEEVNEGRLSDLQSLPPDWGYNPVGMLQLDSPTQVFIMPPGRIDANTRRSIEEDMHIMLRILEKQLKQSYVRGYGARYWRDSFGCTQLVQGIYLEGYGTIFLLRVNFPLSPSVNMKNEGIKETKEGVDEVWKQTRNELYTLTDASRGRKDYYDDTHMHSTISGIPEWPIEYDAEKVDSLERELIKGLKHATNIRDLKSDESIIINVSENRPQDSGSAFQPKRAIDTEQDQQFDKEPISTQRPVSQVLMIRAKKSDVDAFYKGELDFDQFRRCVQIGIY